MPLGEHRPSLPWVDVTTASEMLRAGRTLAYPTEAVYGIGCDPAQASAVESVLDTKSRAEDKGLILIASEISQLQAWITPLSCEELDRVQQTWPGHTTWVVPASRGCPGQLTGGRNTIAVRVSAHGTVRELCDAFDGAIVSTSANLSGAPAIRDPAELSRLPGLTAVVRGSLGKAENPSTIYQLSDGKRLR